MTNRYLAQLPRLVTGRAARRPAPVAKGTAVALVAVGAVLAAVAVGRRSVAARELEPHAPEPPVIVWEG